MAVERCRYDRPRRGPRLVSPDDDGRRRQNKMNIIE